MQVLVSKVHTAKLLRWKMICRIDDNLCSRTSNWCAEELAWKKYTLIGANWSPVHEEGAMLLLSWRLPWQQMSSAQSINLFQFPCRQPQHNLHDKHKRKTNDISQAGLKFLRTKVYFAFLNTLQSRGICIHELFLKLLL